MKKIKLLFALSLILTSLISCSKDDDNEQDYQLNKLNYDGELYSFESFTADMIIDEFYFLHNSFCPPTDSLYTYKFSFYDTKSINQYTVPSLIVNIGPFTKDFHSPLPIELNSSSCQNFCNCLFFDFIEETDMNSPIRHTSVIAHAQIKSIDPIEINFEGVFDNKKNFRFHFKGKSIPGFPYGM